MKNFFKELDNHKIFEDKFMGNPVLKISKVDKNNNERDYGLIISFGLTKARYILKNISSIEQFIRKHGFECDKSDTCNNDVLSNDDLSDLSIFVPEDTKMALGYLFWATMKSDGNIHKLEINALKSNLSKWSNDSAKLILESINMIEPSVSSSDISKIFNGSDHFSSDIKSSIVHCLEFVKKKESAEVRKIMFNQIMGIIKSDSKIHENERWIREITREIWDDI